MYHYHIFNISFIKHLLEITFVMKHYLETEPELIINKLVIPLHLRRMGHAHLQVTYDGVICAGKRVVCIPGNQQNFLPMKCCMRICMSTWFLGTGQNILAMVFLKALQIKLSADPVEGTK